VIEITDLVFAVDSIPAIFGVSTDPFILYTSNIFAIL
jgi:tellurium resistance protein terC family protein